MDQDTTLGTAKQTEKPHTLTVAFSWLKSSSLGLLRHGHFKNQASKDSGGKNHFPSASASFCFKMTFCIQQHELSFELSEFSLTQSSLAGSGFRRHSVVLSAAGHQEKQPYLVLIVEKQLWKSLDVFYVWWPLGSGAVSSTSVRKSPLLPRWQCHQAWHNTPLNTLVFPFFWDVRKAVLDDSHLSSHRCST